MEKEQKKSNNKRRLLLLILLLVCTLTLLGGATYAWFTANTKVAIEAMDLEVQVANGIEISADAEHWSSRLNLDDLYKAAGLISGTDINTTTIGSVNQFPKFMLNVSSVGNINKANNRVELFNGTVSQVCYMDDEKGNPIEDKEWTVVDDVTDPENEITIDKCGKTIFTALSKTSVYNEGKKACLETGEGGTACDDGVGVVTFDMYLKLDANSIVSLAPGSYVNAITPESDYGLKDTMRVAFVTLGTQPNSYYSADAESVNENGVVKSYADAGDSEKDPLAEAFKGYAGAKGARIMNAFGSISVWEPNNNHHTTAAISKGISDYGFTSENLKPETVVPTHGMYANPADPKGDGSEPSELPIYLSDANGTASETNTIGPKFFAEQKAVLNAGEYGEGKPYKNKINYFSTAQSTRDDIASGKKGITQAKDLFTARAGVTKVRVYIWVEGNDVDTVNAATTSSIQALFSFTTANTTGAIADDSADLETYTNVKDPIYRDGYTDPLAPVGP